MKNMMTKAMVGLILIHATISFGGEWVLFNRDTWHLNVGAAFDPGVKTRLSEGAYVGRPMPGGALTKAAAANLAANGESVDGKPKRRLYANGSWIDLSDPGYTGGGDGAGKTGYYYFCGGHDDNTFSLGSVAYVDGERAFHAKDDSAMPGLFAELSHGLYRDVEDDWGVNLAFGVHYFFRNKAYRSSGSFCGNGRYDSTITVDNPYGTHFNDPAWNYDWHGGVYGSGEFSDGADGGYATPIAPTVAVTDVPGLAAGSVSARGDYRNLELMLVLKPYYDVKDWLRLVGTIGVVVGRQGFDFSSTVVEGGARSSYGRNFHDWDVYGVAGLGAQLRYDDWTIGFDFLARFLDDELEIRDPHVNGTVERGNWVFRVGLGYEF